MTAIDTMSALFGCLVISLTITSSLDFLLPVERNELAPALGLAVGGTGAAFFLFRFAGVL